MINIKRKSPRRSNVTFHIKFLLDPTQIATGIEIEPSDGDAFLEPVIAPGPSDNKVLWRSSERFQIKFVQIEDQSKPLVPDKIIPVGEDNENWNDAELVGTDWEYGFTLTASSATVPKKTVAAKYSVKHFDSHVEFDPVLIITH